MIPCKRSISSTHQGIGGIKQHVNEKIHLKNTAAIKEKRNKDFQPSSSSSSDYQQIRSEVLHSNYIVQHIISFKIADHLVPLYGKLFPNSKIARNFKYKSTKITCILNNALHPHLQSYLVDYMSEYLHALVNDGSSDGGPSKVKPLFAFIFDVRRSNQVEFKFFSMSSTTGEDFSKSETLFESINSALFNDKIDWDNVVSMGLNNTNTNMGC